MASVGQQWSVQSNGQQWSVQSNTLPSRGYYSLSAPVGLFCFSFGRPSHAHGTHTRETTRRGGRCEVTPPDRPAPRPGPPRENGEREQGVPFPLFSVISICRKHIQ